MPDFNEVHYSIGEMDRQLIIRGLAIQSIQSPGFREACRGAAHRLAGAEMFDDLRKSMMDIVPHPPPKLKTRIDLRRKNATPRTTT